MTETLVPTSAAEAAGLYGGGVGVTVVAGGTIVVPAIVHGRLRLDRALLLHRAGLAGVTRDGARVTIGAMTPLASLAELPEPLRSAVARVADGEIRGQATLGGNVCARPDEAPRGDLQGPLIALGAVVRSAGAGGERSEAIEDFLPHRAERLLLDVAFDEPAAGAYAYLDRPHTHEYTALAVSAARRQDGPVRLGVTGAGPHGLLLRSPEAVDELPFADDAIASAWYRRRTLPVLVRRALSAIEEQA